MKKYGMKVLGLAGHTMTGQRDVPVGRWIKSADVEAHDGRGEATFTVLPNNALAFESFAEAHACWTQVSTVRPLRDDGQPNRPLTAFTVEIMELPS